MLKKTDFYINGEWVAPAEPNEFEVINPADETPFAVISMGSKADVDKAVAAARAAFETYSQTSHEDRIALLEKLLEIYKRRSDEMAETISKEMGAPITLATTAQSAAGMGHLHAFIKSLKAFEFQKDFNDKGERIEYEPIGVCGLITPWNWPMNQVMLKVAPALAVGCTVILKPSEIAPLSAMLLAEMIDEAGFPAGVFNLVNGDGINVGSVMSSHPGIDMMSFTGSTRAGIAVAKAGAETVKRVSLELGGKSPNVIFDNTDLEKAVKLGVLHCVNNTGQSCNAPTRMLVQKSVYDDAVKIAEEVGSKVSVGNPAEEGRHIGPLVSEMQFNKVQDLIEAAVAEGARTIVGGPGRPEGMNRGYYVRPTIFADVNNDMRIAREEVFGPVLVMIPFEDEEDAIRIANDTPYGLAAYVQSGDMEQAHRVARRLRAGMVQINGAQRPMGSPFGGYKQSGNGREGGHWGLEDFLEVKAISGYMAAE